MFRVDELADLIGEPSARGISAAVARLIREGRLVPGERLPTVREVSRSLGLSPTTVSDAWRRCAQSGLIEGRGRLGTFVVGHRDGAGPRRYRSMSAAAGHVALDLSTGSPDPELLPNAAVAMASLPNASIPTNYWDRPVLPQLEGLLRARVPFEADVLTVVDGALDALDRVASAVLAFGDRVIVEDPTFPPLLDLFDLLGVDVLPVACDEEGMLPDAFSVALGLRPRAVFLQPRAHNPTGRSMSPERAQVLAGLVGASRVWVVEDDHSGGISIAPNVSLGTWLPDRTVRIESFSKSHGPDLRLAAVAGPHDVMDQVLERRAIGPAWSSRILQGVLAAMLSDSGALARVEEARSAYHDRRSRLVAALDALGVPTVGRDGINLWLPVADERVALVSLAAQGIGVAPGAPFMVRASQGDYVRVTTAMVRRDFDGLASQLADAAAGRRRESQQQSR